MLCIFLYGNKNLLLNDKSKSEIMEPTSNQVTKAFGRVWKLCDEPQIEGITIQVYQFMYYRRYNNSGISI